MKAGRFFLLVCLVLMVAAGSDLSAYEGPPPTLAEKIKSCDLYAKVHVSKVKLARKWNGFSMATVKILSLKKGETPPSGEFQIFYRPDTLANGSFRVRCPAPPSFKSGYDYFIWANYDEAKKRFMINGCNFAQKVSF